MYVMNGEEVLVIEAQDNTKNIMFFIACVAVCLAVYFLFAHMGNMISLKHMEHKGMTDVPKQERYRHINDFMDDDITDGSTFHL